MISHEVTIYGEETESAQFNNFNITPGRKYSQLCSDPELVMRNYGLPIRWDDERGRQRRLDEFRSQAETVRTLQNDYDLYSPNPVYMFENLGADGIQAYQASSKIHGQYFTYEHLADQHHGEWQLDKILKSTATQAFGNLLSYYEDVTDGIVGNYQADLRLGNLIYGRLQGDHEDHVYVFDLGEIHFCRKWVEGYSGVRNTIDNPRSPNLQRDLSGMQGFYAEDFGEFQRRLDVLAAKAEVKHARWREMSDIERIEKYKRWTGS